MTTETQEQEQASGTTETVNDGEQNTSLENTANSDGTAKDGEGEAFDASSYEESFGLPADTLKGVENAEDALEAIRGYTDKTLTAGLRSKVVAAADTSAGKVADQEQGTTVIEPGKKTASQNPELDALRADLTEVKEKLATRERLDLEARSSEIDSRVVDEIDAWESPKYGTSKSRNFKQAKAVTELEDLARTHIKGFRVDGRQPPVVEKLLRQVRAFHDDEYKPSSDKKNSDAALGSPGTGSRSAKKDDGKPKNIHEALQQNSFE